MMTYEVHLSLIQASMPGDQITYHVMQHIPAVLRQIFDTVRPLPAQTRVQPRTLWVTYACDDVHGRYITTPLTNLEQVIKKHLDGETFLDFTAILVDNVTVVAQSA